MRSLSSSIGYALLDLRSGRILQSGVAAEWSGELPSVLRAGLWGFASGDRVEHLLEGLRGQVLVGILADLDNRGVDAGAQAFDLLPGEIAVGGYVKGLMVDAPLANLLKLLAAAQQARRRAAPLDVGFATSRLEQEHGVEGCDFEHPDRRHAEQISDVFDRLARRPAAALLLGTPQDRDHSRSLPALRVFRDLPLRPVEILRREREARGLQFGRGEAADGHFFAVLA